MSLLSDTVNKDHRELEAYYNLIVDSDDVDEQTRFQNKFTWELARHTVGEELVVYPAMEKYLRDGVEVVERDRRGNHTIKEQLQKFQDMSGDDPAFIPTIASLMGKLNEHIEGEETADLVKLESAITLEESKRLSRSFERTKMFVPTRSHPNIPDRPPFATAVGLMMAPLDRVADLFRRWPEEGLYSEPSLE